MRLVLLPDNSLHQQILSNFTFYCHLIARFYLFDSSYKEFCAQSESSFPVARFSPSCFFKFFSVYFMRNFGKYFSQFKQNLTHLI